MSASARQARDWDFHTAINDHVIPNVAGVRRPGSGPAAVRPLKSASDGRYAHSSADPAHAVPVHPHSSASQYGTPVGTAPHSSSVNDDTGKQLPRSSRAPLHPPQAALYSALFGEPPPGRSGGVRTSASGSDAPPSGEVGGWPSSEERGTGSSTVADPDVARQIERAVRKAMRGGAIERQQAVDAALAEARRAHEAEKAAMLARLQDDCEEAAARARAEAATVATAEREALLREASRERTAAIARAVDAAEKAKEVAWRRVLEAHSAEAETRLEAANKEREAAIRRVQRAKDAAVADAIRSAREKISQVELEAARALDAERERVAAVERTARRQASKKAELLNERTWAEAEQLREQAVAAARVEGRRELQQEIDRLRAAAEAERAELLAQAAQREADAHARADERLAAMEARSTAARAEAEASHRAAVEALCAEHAQAIEAVRERAATDAVQTATREHDERLAAAVSDVRREAEREKRAALRATSAEAEKALRRVMEAAKAQQAKAVAEARRQFEEDLLRSP
jgi:hypothetical protein